MIKLKNILAENMLRYGTKNLTESQKQTINMIVEEVLSGVTDGCAVVGATKSNTTNVGAVAAFIKAGYTVTGTISETTCIKKAAGASSSAYTVGPKTVQATHYLKIGEKVISGTAPSSMIILFSDLKGQAIEAAGNGIFALGRALKAKSDSKKYGLTMSSGLSITLNTSKVILSMFNVRTGFQDAANDFAGSTIRTLIGMSALEPTVRTANVVTSGLDRRAKGITEVSRLYGSSAMPFIADMTDAEKEILRPIGPIDITTSVNINKKAGSEEAAKPIVEGFCKRYFQAWVDSYVAKFKKFIEIRCTDAGVPTDALQTLNALLDTYGKTQNLSTYTSQTTAKLFVLYRTTTTTSGGRTGATTTSTSIAGKEGSITGASGQK